MRLFCVESDKSDDEIWKEYNKLGCIYKYSVAILKSLCWQHSEHPEQAHLAPYLGQYKSSLVYPICWEPDKLLTYHKSKKRIDQSQKISRGHYARATHGACHNLSI